MKIKKIILVLCSTIAFYSIAQPDSSSILADIKIAEDTIYYSGLINAVSVQKVLEIIKTGKFKRLNISSRGGEIVSAMDFGQVVFDYRLDVVVPDLCNSSCANYIFPAGRNKKIENGALVMWHGDARQLDFLKIQSFLENKALMHSEQMTESDWSRLRYSKKSVDKQDKFYEKIGIDGRIARIGQEIGNPVHLWALNTQSMAVFKLTEVDAPQDYGSPMYCTQWLPKYYSNPTATCLMLSVDEINAWRDRERFEFERASVDKQFR